MNIGTRSFRSGNISLSNIDKVAVAHSRVCTIWDLLVLTVPVQ